MIIGLPNRPRKINKATVKKSAPKFLMDIYKTLLEEDDDGNQHQRAKRSLELGFSGDEQKKIDQSDVIMTFESISTLIHLIPGVFSVVLLIYICFRSSCRQC